ncbi:HupE/UreJ family protein [Paenibacillus piri]|uniref:HupE/UreJ family protein n=1 Tax=Paenibacillus piri TaxID=2547395 RepID=A0A4R5KAI9_9BACL|nr:HupE/UreJ family protein [Paenibacillus piri]TDF90585.1 HupE/UreJ family protein [Paenibacillus piri]
MMHSQCIAACKAVFIMLAVLTMAFFPFSQPVHAHTYSASFTTLTLTKSHTWMTFAIDELSAMELTYGDLYKRDRLDQKQFDAIRDRLESVIKENLTLHINDKPVPWTHVESFELVRSDKGAKVELKAAFPPVSAYEPISMIDNLYLHDPLTNYVNLLSVNYGSQSNSAAIAGKDRAWAMTLTAADYAGLQNDIEKQPNTDKLQTNGQKTQLSDVEHEKPASGWYTFFELGMRHILSGYDHLLFLLSLLLARQTFRQYASLITSFTIAHSLTLTLTVLDIIHVPAWIVEPAIALSICYVAVENMIRKQVTFRWVLTFVFGLIHGMGFADILTEMDIPQKELAVDLISFNLGIEAVQIMIVSAVLPLIYLLKRWKYSRNVMTAGSAAALLLGGGWFIERIFS